MKYCIRKNDPEEGFSRKNPWKRLLILPGGASVLALALAFFLTCTFPLSAFAEGKSGSEADPAGYWLTENGRAVIKVETCEQDIKKRCGKVYWIIDGGMQNDEKNPEAALRDRPLCGLEVLSGFERANHAPSLWEYGKIYKADEGEVYNASLRLQEENKLKVRGYVGIPLFGKSQLWRRVNAQDYPACAEAE